MPAPKKKECCLQVICLCFKHSESQFLQNWFCGHTLQLMLWTGRRKTWPYKEHWGDIFFEGPPFFSCSGFCFGPFVLSFFLVFACVFFPFVCTYLFMFTVFQFIFLFIVSPFVLCMFLCPCGPSISCVLFLALFLLLLPSCGGFCFRPFVLSCFPHLSSLYVCVFPLSCTYVHIFTLAFFINYCSSLLCLLCFVCSFIPVPYPFLLFFSCFFSCCHPVVGVVLALLPCHFFYLSLSVWFPLVQGTYLYISIFCLFLLCFFIHRFALCSLYVPLSLCPIHFLCPFPGFVFCCYHPVVGFVFTLLSYHVSLSIVCACFFFTPVGLFLLLLFSSVFFLHFFALCVCMFFFAPVSYHFVLSFSWLYPFCFFAFVAMFPMLFGPALFHLFFALLFLRFFLSTTFLFFFNALSWFPMPLFVAWFLNPLSYSVCCMVCFLSLFFLLFLFVFLFPLFILLFPLCLSISSKICLCLAVPKNGRAWRNVIVVGEKRSGLENYDRGWRKMIEGALRDRPFRTQPVEGQGDVHLVEAATAEAKNSTTKERRTRLMPFAALGWGLSLNPWCIKWEMQINELGSQWLMPAFSEMTGCFLERRLTTSEANHWLRDILFKAGLTEDAAMEYSTHSCKATLATWAGKFSGFSIDKKRMLTHHLQPDAMMPLLYSRDNVTALQIKIFRMLHLMRTGAFQPDLSAVARIEMAVADIDWAPPQDAEWDQSDSDVSDDEVMREDRALVQDSDMAHRQDPGAIRKLRIHVVSSVVHQLRDDSSFRCGRDASHRYRELLESDQLGQLLMCQQCSREPMHEPEEESPESDFETTTSRARRGGFFLLAFIHYNGAFAQHKTIWTEKTARAAERCEAFSQSTRSTTLLSW